MNAYQELLQRLDDFVRKYYANQLLRGTLVLLSCLLSFLLLVSVGEFFLYLPVAVRIGIAVFFVLAVLLALFFWIVKPLAGMARLGKIISYEEAARIIGNHFPDVSDQLLNILQLKEKADPRASAALIEASIGQKVERLRPVPMIRAVEWRRSRRVLPFLLPLLFVSIVLLWAAPRVFTESTARLLRPTTEFVKPAPFEFILLSDNLEVVRNSDFSLELAMQGKTLPASVSIVFDDEEIPMQQTRLNRYRYQLRNCVEDLSFRFYAAGFYSKTYRLKILQRPMMAGVALRLDFPAYTGRPSEQRNAMGDLVVPIGTRIFWEIRTQHADKAFFSWGGAAPVALQQQSADLFSAQIPATADTNYEVVLLNTQSRVTQRFPYRLQVIPDKAPVVQMQQFADSVSGTQIVLNGTAGDDYGISRIQFHYRVVDATGKEMSARQQLLKGASGTATNFQHYVDLASIALQNGQRIEYYVEVWDNDAVHGAKSTRTEIRTYRALDAKELDSAINNNSKQINASLSSSARQSQKMQQQMESLERDLLKSESTQWQQQQALQDMMRMQQQMQQNLQQIKKRFEEQMRQTEQKNLSSDLKEKQEALKEQLDQVMNKELNDQMRKLQEMMQRLQQERNKPQDLQQLREMQEENKLFSMDMERLQQLMQKLDAQIRMEEMANKLEQLSGRESELRQETGKSPQAAKDLAKKQEGLKKELQQTMKQDFSELKKSVDAMKEKQSVDQEQQKGEQAEKAMQQSEQSLEQQNSDAAQQSQSKAAQNLQEMAESLRQKSAGMNGEEIEMNIRAVRQILSNLVRLSFDQESLIGKVSVTSTGSPVYLSNLEQQQGLHDNSLVIRDSLFALSKKLFKLSARINKETNDLERHMRGALSGLEKRNVMLASSKQQYVMTHANNLALMLNEILSNLMQQQSQGKGGGGGSCNKPGGSNPKPGAGKQLKDIISKQEGLGKKMGQEGKSGKEGQKPGESGRKPGEKGQGQSPNSLQNGGSEGNAQQLVQLAQEQAAIRRQLAELSRLLNSQGNTGMAKELKELQEQMDRNETDLVNRNANPELYRRQQEILSRLLETEKTLREQEEDNKRTSRNVPEISRPVPPELKPYLEDNGRLREQYQTLPPGLRPYYRELNERYFGQIR